MIFVFSGRVVIDGQHVVRSLLEDIAYEEGHHVSPVVDQYTGYLVTTKEHFEKSKVRKVQDAKKYGVQCVTPETFLKLMGR